MKTVLTFLFGTLMVIGLIIGIIFVFVFIFNPSVIYFKILISGWAAYLIFGRLVPD